MRLLDRGRFGALFLLVTVSMLPARAWSFACTQFWGGHPNTFRSFFAWASLSYGFTMIVHPVAFDGRPYNLMRLVMGVDKWAALFVLHWMLLSIVILPRFRERLHEFLWDRGIHWTLTRRSILFAELVINCYGCVLWATYVVLQDVSLASFAINSAMERIAVVYSVWAILRTGMSRRTDSAVSVP